MAYSTNNTSSVISVTNFGAKGDGVTDDTNAIKRCFAFVTSGYTVIFPKGTYLLTDYVDIAVNNITIIGNQACLISNSSGQDRKFNISQKTNIIFDGININGGNLTVLAVASAFDTYTPSSNPGTIHFQGSINCVVKNCNFTGVNWPITLLGACYNIQIHNNNFSSYYSAVYSYFDAVPNFGFSINPVCQGFYSNSATYNQGDYIMWTTPEANFDGTPYFYICTQNSTTGSSNSPTSNPSIWIGTIYEPRNTQVSPQRIIISDNNFYQGLWQCWIYAARYFGRYYPPVSVFCSGAIKFRGAANEGVNFFQGIVVTNNVVQGAGQIGIELQTTYNAAISNNTIENADIGISISYALRVNVSNNNIKNINYAGIECDGDSGGDILATSHENVLSNNIIDGRDDYGSPANFIDNLGIVISNTSLNIIISNCITKYLKTGIKIAGTSGKILINGCYIVTNEESGTGGAGSYLPYMMPYVQGIYIELSSNIDIIGCKMEPTLQAWQRMVNIILCNNININGCNITSNNTPIYAKSSYNLNVDSCTLQMGAYPGYSGAGNEPRFLAIDASDANCSGINFSNNIFRGTGAYYGMTLYAPSYFISGVEMFGNNTTNISTVNSPFINQTFFGGGYISGINIYSHLSNGNLGVGTLYPSNKLQVTSGHFALENYESAIDLRFKTNVNDPNNFSAYLRKFPSAGDFRLANNSGSLTLLTHDESMIRFGTNSQYNCYVTGGLWGFGGTYYPSNLATVSIYGSNSTSSKYAAIFINNTPSALMGIRNDGFIEIPVINSFTTANAANLYTDGNGIFKSTSSEKYKRNISDYTKGLSDLDKLRPVTYQGKSPIDGDQFFAGFIAEEVNASGLTEYVSYNQSGEANGLHYAQMTALLVNAVKELSQRVSVLEEKLKNQ